MSGLRRVPFICLTLLVALSVVPAAPAADSAVEELTKVMPEGVIYFVATSGGAALEDDFQKSAMGRLWNDPGLRTFAGSVKAELMKLLAKEAGEERVPQMIVMGLGYAQSVLDRPLVVGIAEVEAQKGPPVGAFAIVKADESKAELAAAMTQVETMLGEGAVGEVTVGSLTMHGLKGNDAVPLYWGWVGNYLVLAVNDAQGSAVAHLTKPRAAATDHLKKVPGHGDLLAVYYDLQKALSIVQGIVAAEGGEEVARLIKGVIEGLGVGNMGTVVGRVGFSGANLVSDSFAEAPAPRTGLLAAFKPVDASAFGMVDGRAVSATAFNCDLAGIYDMVLNTIKKVSPDEGYPEVLKGLSEVESELGFSIRDGLLKSLGGPVVFYSLPAGQMVEAPMGGVVAMLKLNDAALFEKIMTQLGVLLSEEVGDMLQIGSQTAEDGGTIHVWTSPPLALAQVMPTWSVAKDHVVIGSNTALCKMGLTQLAGGDAATPSLLATAKFKQAVANLPEGLVSITYTDAEVMFNQMMMQVRQFWPMATMFASQAGITLPVLVPSVEHIATEMKPSIEYSYVGPDGFYSHYAGSGLEVSLRGVAGTALGAGIAMPALARARQQARRMTSGTNLSCVGKACWIYADDHDDRLPPDLDVLVAEADLAPKCLESKRRPKDFDGPSYIYIPGQTLSMNPGNFVAYENPQFCEDGINVLHLDGHVEFMKPQQFREELKATYERLGREMPEIKFKD